MEPMADARSIDFVVTALRTTEGGGFPVRRPFPTRSLPMVDPFLLLDEMGPVEWPPGRAVGAPDHPHRGFETVTYLLQGRMRHRDSAGHEGTLTPGDVQWMTAGAGVIHSELPDPEFLREGGRSHGFQLWVNLPARDKMTAPRYQEVPSERLPVVEADGGRVWVRVIAGEALGARATVQTRTPILYAHFRLKPGGGASPAVPRSWNALLYVFGGRLLVETRSEPGGIRELTDAQLAVFRHDGDEIRFRVADEARAACDFLLLGGEPLGEPVARYGPFVMNTEEEIRQAIDDFRAGRLGRPLD